MSFQVNLGMIGAVIFMTLLVVWLWRTSINGEDRELSKILYAVLWQPGYVKQKNKVGKKRREGDIKVMGRRCLFVTFNDVSTESYGGSRFSVQNLNALRTCGNVDVHVVRKQSTARSLLSMLGLHFPPLSNSDLEKIIKDMEKNSYDTVFLASSLLGEAAKKIKREYPAVQVITSCQNVETDYIKVRFSDAVHRMVYGFLARRAEREAIKYSDKVIVLNRRDQNRMKELYGREAEYLMPISFRDKVLEHELDMDAKTQGRMKGIFIGALGRSNYEGAKWFAENVACKTDADFIIAGKGFDKAAEELVRDNVQVFGMVEDLKSLYLEADFVIAPILFGGGMKVKIAEALMYGRTVFGTTEAFEGYEVNYEKVGGLCNTAEEFIEKINAYASVPRPKVNAYSRRMFLEKYETGVTDKVMREIIGQI